MSRIRAARAEDAEAVAVLASQLGYPSTTAEVETRLARLVGLVGQQVLLGEVDGAVRGWLHAAEVHTVESAPYAEIVGLIVDEGHRGSGLGAALVAAAKEWARVRGLGEMRVRSNVVRERAHRFYERLGFRETKRQAVFRLSL